MSADDFIPTVSVPRQNSGLDFRWAGHTGLAVYSAEDGSSRMETDEQLDKICFLREGSILYDSELRKLINESNATFIASRNIPRNVDPRKRVLELSREHRSSVRQCIENMQLKMKISNTDVYENWVEVLDNVDHVWHLCELLLLDVIPGGIVLSKLLEWTRLHSSDYDLMVSEVIAHSHTRGADLRYPEYWELVTRLLIEGRFEACRALLRLHSRGNSAEFSEAEMLIRTLPLYSVYSGMSVPEFTSRWRGWKSTVRSKISMGAFASCPQLQNLMKLLGSEEPLFDLLKPYCPTWYQMMTAVILLTDQTAKIDSPDLSHYAGQCIAHCGGTSKLKLLDHTLLAILDSNVSSAIKKLQLTSDGGWCAVHLTNLLSLVGLLSTPSGKSVDFETMLLEYGQLLMTSQSYWQVGLTYLEHCPGNGLEVIRIALQELPLTSEEIALRIITAAKDYGLNDVVRSIGRVMAHQKLRNDNLAGALSWALSCDDADMAGNVADKFLKSYARGCSEAEVGAARALENLGNSTLINPRLTFLAKYCEFFSLYESDKDREAADLLVRLLESKVSPKYFWLTLLSHSVPFLQPNTPTLSHDQTLIILACLEELTMDVASNIVEVAADFSERTKEIRKAITKHLAITTLKESSPIFPSLSVIKCT